MRSASFLAANHCSWRFASTKHCSCSSKATHSVYWQLTENYSLVRKLLTGRSGIKQEATRSGETASGRVDAEPAVRSSAPAQIWLSEEV